MYIRVYVCVCVRACGELAEQATVCQYCLVDPSYDGWWSVGQ